MFSVDVVENILKKFPLGIERDFFFLIIKIKMVKRKP